MDKKEVCSLPRYWTLWFACVLFIAAGGTAWAASAENTFVSVSATNATSIALDGTDFYICTQDDSVKVKISAQDEFELVEPDPSTLPIPIDAGDSEDYAVEGIPPETKDGAGTIYVPKVELKSLTFTSDHGVMTDYDTDWGGDGGTVYGEPEWDSSQNYPISHTKDSKITADIVLCVEPSGLTFDIEGDSSVNALDFQKTDITSTGSDQTISVTADDKLSTKIDILEEDINWSIDVFGTECEAGQSGPHIVYVVWGTPTGTEPTLNRVDWVCDLAQGATSVSDIADIVGPDAVDSSRFDGDYSIFGDDPDYDSAWELLDPDPESPTSEADCGSLSTLLKYELDMLGATGSEVRFVYARHDSWTGLWDTTGTGNETDGEGHELGIWMGAYNYYEGCCHFDGKWWMGGFGTSENSAYDVLIYCTGGSEGNLDTTWHQCWDNDTNTAVSFPPGTP